MLTIKYRKIKEGRKTIDALVSYNGFRKEISTGIKLPEGIRFVAPRTFEGGSVIQRANLDKELGDWESEMRDNYTKMIAIHGQVVSREVFKAGIASTNVEVSGVYIDNRKTLSAFLDQVTLKIDSGGMTKSNGRAYSARSISLIKYTIDILEKFIIKHGDFDFGKYNDDTENVLGRAAVSKAYQSMSLNIKAFLVNDMKFGQYTTSNTLMVFKSIINERADFHGLRIHRRLLNDLKYSTKQKSIVVAMSEEQFEWIMNNEELIRSDFRHYKIVDYMYAALLTSARISDLVLFTSANIIDTPDGKILSYVPTKTKNSSSVRVEIPITDRLMNIFNKNMERYNGKILPPMLKFDAARKLREVLKKYEIFQNNVQYLDKNGDITTGPFYDAFVFHSSRASLITYLLNKGEQETVIKSISGHTLDSSSFKVYANITNQSKMRTMQRLAFGIKKGD